MRLVVVHWFVTSKCNMGCRFCYKPEYTYASESPDRSHVIDKLIGAGVSQITFTGGEPLLCDGLLNLVSLCKSRGLNTVVHTNAKLLTKGMLQAFRPYLDNLSLAIDGSNAHVADGIREEPGHFDRVIRAIQFAQELEIPFSIKTMACKANYDDFENMASMISSLKVPKGRGLWYISEFVARNKSKKYIEEFSLNDGDFGRLRSANFLKNTSMRVRMRSVAEIQNNPTFFLAPDNRVFGINSITQREEVVGNLASEAVELLWSRILDRSGLSV